MALHAGLDAGLQRAMDALIDLDWGRPPRGRQGEPPAFSGLAAIEPIQRCEPWPRGDASYSVTAEIAADLECLREQGVSIPRPGEIREYLLAHPDITTWVLAVSLRAVERFGASAQLSLELYSDPESDDEYATLYVRQLEYEDGIMDAIEEVAEVYDPYLAGASGYFLITTDFQPPEEGQNGLRLV